MSHSTQFRYFVGLVNKEVMWQKMLPWKIKH